MSGCELKLNAMPDTNILLRALDTRWRRLRKDWRRARRRFSGRSIHDLRVASRRLIAVLDTLRSMADDPEIQKCRRRIKKSLGALSPLRDVHVQHSYLSKMSRRFPQLERFQKSLSAKEDRIARKVQRLLKKDLKLGRVIDRIKKGAETRRDSKAMIRILDRRYREVLRLAGKVDPADPATIHRLRLAFKRFRYTAEVVQPLVKTDVTKARLRQFHAFQTMLGGIQDIDVLSARLEQWAGKEKKRTEKLQPVLKELERRKEKQIAACVRSANRFFPLWKI